MKIPPVGAECHVDGRANMTKLIVAFRNFANAPNICKLYMLKWKPAFYEANILFCDPVDSDSSYVIGTKIS
jgi:hypothetical protein